MDRKEFIKTCGFGCLGATSIGLLLQGCVSTKMITASIENDNLIVDLAAFEKEVKGVKQNLDYVLVQNPQLAFPIYVFRFSDKEYSALLLQCTHQGNELNAYGEKLVCSAHGSQFDNRGKATNGPATVPLKSFPIQISEQNLSISLKKQG